MAFSKYNRGRPFLVINRHATPSDGEHTSVKNWGKIGKWKVEEEIIIVDRVTDKHIIQATVIIDILKREVVKNRYESKTDNNTVIKHYLSTYKDEVADGIEAWMKQKSGSKEDTKKLIDNLQEELDKITIDVVEN